MTWRDQLRDNYPDRESPEPAYNAAAAHQGAVTYLAQEYEQHLSAQETFWKAVTECLGTYGRLAYCPPNFDQPQFTTGYLALEEVDIDKYGESHPVPCIQLSVHENGLIYKHFKRRAMYPWLYRLQDGDTQRAATATIRQCYESQPADNPHFPYVEMEARLISLAGVREATVHHRAEPIRGTYIPGVLLKQADAPIFPEAPPPNYKDGWGYTQQWARLGPPRSPDFVLPTYDPIFDRDLVGYNERLSKRSEEYVDQRNTDMTTLDTFMDILRTAGQVDMRVDDYFERIAAARG